MREIHYQSTIEETVAAAIAVLHVSNTGEQTRAMLRRRALVTFAIMSAAFGLLIGAITRTDLLGRMIAGFLAAALMFGLSQLSIWFMKISLLPKGKGLATDRQHALIERGYREGRYPSYTGPSTIRLTDEGLITETELDRCVHFWPSVQEATRSPEHVLIRLALCQFIAVPLVAFADETEIAEFMDTVNRLCRRAETRRGGQPTVPPTVGPR